MNNRLLILALLAGCFALPGTLSAQGLTPDILRTSAASYYYVAKAGELTMQVNIWGFVKNPGRYEVPTSTNLVQLVSYAGGPITDATLDDVTITHERGGLVSGDLERSVDLENLSELGPEDLLLYPGDTVFIEHNSWLNVRDALIVVTTLAVVTSAAATVIIATQKTR